MHQWQHWQSCIWLLLSRENTTGEDRGKWVSSHAVHAHRRNETELQLTWALAKAPLPQNWTMTGSFAVWKSPTTFHSGGNRTENIDCSAFLFPGIFQYISQAVFLVFRSVIKPYAQWEEIPLPFLQRVLALRGSWGCSVPPRLGWGLWITGQGVVASSGSCHQHTLTACTAGTEYWFPASSASPSSFLLFLLSHKAWTAA